MAIIFNFEESGKVKESILVTEYGPPLNVTGNVGATEGIAVMNVKNNATRVRDWIDTRREYWKDLQVATDNVANRRGPSSG